MERGWNGGGGVGGWGGWRRRDAHGLGVCHVATVPESQARTAHFQQGRSATYTASRGEEGHAKYLASMPPFCHQQASGAAISDKSGSRLTHAETIFFSLLKQCLHSLAQREETGH